MSDLFVDKAKGEMGAIERLLKGLPVIRGYVNKDLRRDADFRLRQTLVSELEAEKQRLFKLQQKLTRSGGLRYTDDVDGAVQKLQTLADRIRTASYGYAGLFDAVRIKEEQLDALHRFDVALAARTYELREAITRLEDAVEARDGVDDAIDALSDKLTELNRLYDERYRAVIDPGLLTGETAPAVQEDWIKAADHYANDEAS
jgi:DNA repair exonuclease SbcCD ATPase subunit